ncbi:MAG: hypothetical protein HWN66_19860 [Candidatus Helarchaeota archaeon]|nr:hypothetical protein [Candidatus Helarchaeota archaeon]
MSEGTTPEKEFPESVHVTSYPKIIFLWPTWVVSFIIWLIAIIGKLDLTLVEYKAFGWVWIGILTFNLFVISFEFAAGKFLAILIIFFGIIIALFTIPDLPTSYWLPSLGLRMEFYLVITIIFSIIYGLLWLSRRFNYLEITHQQITYHVGILADERRYPAPSCHFEKRTEDVFERVMPPFCAKLIMKTETGETAEVLNCVPRINKRLADIKAILDHLKVIQAR